jgi:acyl-CoA synthetase (AMP-forming)/AMP-acid ligase II
VNRSLRERASEADSIVEMLRIHAEESGDSAAYVVYDTMGEEKGRITFSELWQKSSAIASALSASGVAPQAPVLLLLEQGLDFILAYYACLMGRFIAVPSNPPRANRKSERILRIAEHCQPACIITNSVLSARLIGAMGETSLPVLLVEDLADHPSVLPNGMPSGKDLALLQYTSGSTGNPRGVMVSHLNFVKNFVCRIDRWCYRFSDQTSCSSFASWLPVFHDMGLIGSVMDPAFLGTTCHLMTPTTFIQRPEVWLKVISDNKIRASGSPDFGYRLCVQNLKDLQGIDLSSWEVAWNGAEPIHYDSYRSFGTEFSRLGFSDLALTPCYGLAEATLMASGRAPGEPLEAMHLDRRELQAGKVVPSTGPDSASIVNCGRALDGHRLLIVDPETLEELPALTIGEIWFHGLSVAAGYWKEPDLTRETFEAETRQGFGPCLRTGDLGFLDASGHLYITGRRKDLIIVRGANHLPQDIEATVEAAHPSINPTGVAAFAVETLAGEEVGILAEIKRTSLKTLDAQEVFHAIRAGVARTHGVHVHRIGLIKPMSLPKTTSGKVQRSACRKALTESGIELVSEFVEERKEG